MARADLLAAWQKPGGFFLSPAATAMRAAGPRSRPIRTCRTDNPGE